MRAKHYFRLPLADACVICKGGRVVTVSENTQGQCGVEENPGEAYTMSMGLSTTTTSW